MAESPTSPPTEITAFHNLSSNVWKVFGFLSANGKVPSRDVIIGRLCKVYKKPHSNTGRLRAQIWLTLCAADKDSMAT